MFSTDDSEIAKSYGASILFMRSEQNSICFDTTADVLLEVINTYYNIGKEIDCICCIYPTAPFITTDRRIEGFEMLLN